MTRLEVRCALLDATSAETSGHPLCAVRGDPRQPTQVHRVELHGADVENRIVETLRHLSDDLRFADTTGTPDAPGMQRYTLADQRMERSKKC
jgi:hypothetical protein